MSESAKYLCVCRRGNVRSVALARELKEVYGKYAVAVGFETVGAEAIDLLCTWADVVLVVKDEFVDKVPVRFRDKTTVVSIGTDVWLDALHPELTDKVTRLVRALLSERGAV